MIKSMLLFVSEVTLMSVTGGRLRIRELGQEYAIIQGHTTLAV